MALKRNWRWLTILVMVSTAPILSFSTLSNRWAIAFSLATLGTAVVVLAYHSRMTGKAESRDIRGRLRDIEAMIQLNEPHFDAALPWSGWALAPSTLMDILGELECLENPSIVECGSGMSTVHIARKLKALGRGHLHSLEDSADWAEVVQRQIDRSGLAEQVTIHLSPLTGRAFLGRTIDWYSVDEIFDSVHQPINILIVDGPRGESGSLARAGAVPFFWEKLAGNAIVYLDDAQRADEQAILTLWMRHYSLETGEKIKGGRAVKLSKRPGGSLIHH